MKTFLTILFCGGILWAQAQNNSKLEQKNINNIKTQIEEKVEQNTRETDLKLEKLESKIDDNYRETKNEIQIRQDSVEKRMNLYLFFVLGLLTLLGFLGNFFGKRAIKERVERIIQDTAEKYAVKKLDEEIKKKITDEYVNNIIEQHGKVALKNLIDDLEKQGKDVLADHKKNYDKLVKELESIKKGQEKDLMPEEKGKLKEFNNVLSKVKTEEQYTATDWFYKANAALEKKDYNSAIDFSSKAISLNPNDKFFYKVRGVLYSILKDYQKAIEDYNTAIQLDPDNAASFDGRGYSYYALKEYKKASEDLNKAIQIDPNYITPHQNLTELLIIQSNFREAEKVFTNSTKIDKKLKEEVIENYLGSIIAKCLDRDVLSFDKKIEELLKLNPQLSWSFDEIEEWLSKVELGEEVKTYISEKTKLLKKYNK